MIFFHSLLFISKSLKLQQTTLKKSKSILFLSFVRKKSNRKYYGILITKEKTDYCIPFTSKVKKRNPKLTINIKNKKEVIAQLTINNMIPVIDDVVHKVNIKNDKSR